MTAHRITHGAVKQHDARSPEAWGNASFGSFSGATPTHAPGLLKSVVFALLAATPGSLGVLIVFLYS